MTVRTRAMMLLALAMICQGNAGAQYAAYSPAASGSPVRRWVEGCHNGKTVMIYGWHENGYVRYYAQENSHLDGGPVTSAGPTVGSSPTTAPPAPEAASATGVVRGKFQQVAAGQSVQWAGGSPKVGQASDPKPKRRDAIHLTVIGSQADQDAVKADMRRSPELAELAREMDGRLYVQYYAADHPMVANVNLPDGGRPDIVIQDDAGTELDRLHDYPGPEQLATAIRKADPSYRPKREPPNPIRPDVPVEWFWYALGGVAIYYVIKALSKADGNGVKR